jgi:hypothetical protein
VDGREMFTSFRYMRFQIIVPFNIDKYRHQSICTKAQPLQMNTRMSYPKGRFYSSGEMSKVERLDPRSKPQLQITEHKTW